MIFGTSIYVKKLSHSTCRSKGSASTHFDSILALNGNFNSNYQKLSSRLQLLSKLCPNLNVKPAKMIYTSTVIPVLTYCGIVNLNLSKTLLGKFDRIHEWAVGIIIKTNPVKSTPIMNYVKRHACQISNYDYTQNQQEKMKSQ